MPKQVMLIHGGEIFETYEAYLEYLKKHPIDFEKHGLKKDYWKESLSQRLGSEYQVIRPDMPSMRNAKYIEWKIWFDKFIPYFNDGLILIGGSLGGIFLAKYLSENILPKKIKAVFLLAAPYGDNLPDYKMLDFALPETLEKFRTQPEQIYLYHSKDDPLVPFSDLESYKKELPNAIVRIFEDKGHFNLVEFPELVEDIKSF